MSFLCFGNTGERIGDLIDHRETLENPSFPCFRNTGDRGDLNEHTENLGKIGVFFVFEILGTGGI